MYCCVMVEPPCSSPPVAIEIALRAMPVMEKPGSSQNERFSAAMTASFMSCGICS